MKKPQFISIGIAIVLTGCLFLFVRTVPKPDLKPAMEHSADDGHDHGSTELQAITTDSILLLARKQLNTEQVTRLSMLENSISRGDVKDQQLSAYHQLSHFWGDTMKFFQPYAWYEAEAARLENSEKTLTFAAHLFLDNLQQEQNPALRKWAALQAKDLFERSLKINPDNDSASVGLGAVYLFGNISAMPMEGLSHINKVLGRDSTNIYAQMTMAKGSILSGQYDKAIMRLQTVYSNDPSNLDAILLMAEVLERTGKKKEAADWYEKSFAFISREDIRAELKNRIAELRK